MRSDRKRALINANKLAGIYYKYCIDIDPSTYVKMRLRKTKNLLTYDELREKWRAEADKNKTRQNILTYGELYKKCIVEKEITVK